MSEQVCANEYDLFILLTTSRGVDGVGGGVASITPCCIRFGSHGFGIKCCKQVWERVDTASMKRS